MSDPAPLYLDQINTQAASILYALTQQAGSPYIAPKATTVQLDVDLTTWQLAKLWYDDFNLSDLPPPHPPPDTDTDAPQTISANALDFLASELHDAYEQAAAHYGWETNSQTQTPWPDLPTQNQNTMRAAIAHMLTHLGITITPPLTDPRNDPAHNQ